MNKSELASVYARSSFCEAGEDLPRWGQRHGYESGMVERKPGMPFRITRTMGVSIIGRWEKQTKYGWYGKGTGKTKGRDES